MLAVQSAQWLRDFENRHWLYGCLQVGKYGGRGAFFGNIYG